MSWRNVQAPKSSGNSDALASFAEGFASIYLSKMQEDQKQKAKLAEEKRKREEETLTKTREQEEKESQWREAARTLAGEIFPNNPDNPAAINYVYDTISSYEGNIGQATDRLELLSKEKRLSIVGGQKFSDLSGQMDGIFSLESGSGGYNALLSQSQANPDSPMFGKDITKMSMDEVFEFSRVDKDSEGNFIGELAQWNFDNMPKNTKAYQMGQTSTPMGKYQFINKTLRYLRDKTSAFEELGITGDTKFDAKTQDALFLWYAKHKMEGKTSQNEKREAIRGTWEAFGQQKDGVYTVSNKQIDKVIALAESTNPKVVTAPPVRFNFADALGNINPQDADAAGKVEALMNQMAAENYEPTEGEQKLLDGLTSSITGYETERNMFDYATYQKDKPLKTYNDLYGAFNYITELPVSQIKGGRMEQIRIIADLNEKMDALVEKEAKEKALERSGARDAAKPLFMFYKRGENGLINDLGGVPAEYVDGKYMLMDGSGQEVTFNDGKLVPEGQDASQFIKNYNKPLMDASLAVTGGYGAVNNLLQYRKYVEDNPQAFNKYLTTLEGVGKNIENAMSVIRTSVEGGKTYEQFKIEFVQNLTNKTLINDAIFARQLQAAYDIAALRGSSGMALSDNELEKILTQVGYGATDARRALASINIGITTLIDDVESTRLGTVSGLLGNADYVNSLQNMDIGKPFKTVLSQQDFLNETFNDGTSMRMQLDKAINEVTDLPERSTEAGENEVTIEIPQAAKDALKTLYDEATTDAARLKIKQQFDAKAGRTGAADSVLGEQ